MSATSEHYNRGSSHSSRSAGSRSESSQSGTEAGESVAEEPRNQPTIRTSKRKKRRILEKVAEQAAKVAEAAGLPEVAAVVQKYNPAQRVSALKQPEAVDQQRKVTFQPAHSEKAPPTSERPWLLQDPKGKGKDRRVVAYFDVGSPKGKGKDRKGTPHQQRQLPGKGGKGSPKKGRGGGKGKPKKKGMKGAGGGKRRR